MSEFLALIEWFDSVLGLIAAYALGVMTVLVAIVTGYLKVERKREP